MILYSFSYKVWSIKAVAVYWVYVNGIDLLIDIPFIYYTKKKTIYSLHIINLTMDIDSQYFFKHNIYSKCFSMWNSVIIKYNSKNDWSNLAQIEMTPREKHQLDKKKMNDTYKKL